MPLLFLFFLAFPCYRNGDWEVKSHFYDHGIRRALVYLRIGVRAALYPIIALGSYLVLGALLIFSVYRDQPFNQKFGSTFLIANYPWLDPLVAVYQLIGFIMLYGVVLSMLDRAIAQARLD